MESAFLKIDQDVSHIVGYPGEKNLLQIDRKKGGYALWI